MFQCNIWSVSENYARLRAHFLLPVVIDTQIYIRLEVGKNNN